MIKMKLTVMDMFKAEGTPNELSEYTALIVLILKIWTDKQEKEQVKREIENLWNSIQKGGEEEH